MSWRVKYLFLSVLMLFVLTQVVVLRWEPEAIFFVTWFSWR